MGVWPVIAASWTPEGELFPACRPDLLRTVDMTTLHQMWTSPVAPAEHLCLLNSSRLGSAAAQGQKRQEGGAEGWQDEDGKKGEVIFRQLHV